MSAATDSASNPVVAPNSSAEVPATDTTSATVGLNATATQAPGTRSTEVAAVLPAGTTVGRYVVLHKIAAGAMGAVYKAFDPELDRKVAIKVVAVSRTEDAQATNNAAARLVREAKALAQLSHPNVVAVYDVGSFDCDVFIAMALVEGQTLRAWNRQRDDSIARKIEVYAAAGRGLAAAHKAGIVHRDFKPDNVLIGDDGRVQVVDFGIATAESVQASDEITGDGFNESSDGTFDSVRTPLTGTERLTQVGALIGTPSYMSPEQFLGSGVDAKSDQFSFCVALHESLYGRRPFSGKTVAVLRRNVLSGRLRDPGKESRVPARLRRILARGLAVEPDDRYESMDELLEDLGKDPRAAARRVAIAVGAIALVGMTIATITRSGAAPITLCKNATAELSGRWDGEAREAARQAFAATGKPYAAELFRRVATVMDGYAARWVETTTSACEATHVHGTQSDRMLDLRMSCLNQRRDALASLATVLRGELDASTLDKALPAALALPRLDTCADADALSIAVPLPTDREQRELVKRTRAALADARALEVTAQYREGLEIVKRQQSAAKKADYAPLLAELRLLEGELELGLGNTKQAESLCQDAIKHGSRARDDALVADAWIAMLRAIGHGGEPAVRLRLHPLAEAAVARAGDEPVQSGRLERALGSLYYKLGKYDLGRTHLDRAIALLEPALGSDHPDVAGVLKSLANIYLRQGEFERARPLYERTRAVLERAYGDQHPLVAGAIYNLAHLAFLDADYAKCESMTMHSLELFRAAHGEDHARTALAHDAMGHLQLRLGRHGEAEASFRNSLRIREKVQGVDHPSTASSLASLAWLLLEVERDREAEALLIRARQIWVPKLGPDHRRVAQTLIGFASVDAGRGRFAQAMPRFEKAIEILRSALGGEHHEVAIGYYRLARGLALAGRFSEALPHYQRAAEIFRTSLGDDSASLMPVLSALGECYVELGQPGDAIPTLERVLKLRTKHPSDDPYPDARTKFALARALWPAPGERPRALELARQARGVFSTEPRPSARKILQRADRWLARRAGDVRK